MPMVWISPDDIENNDLHQDKSLEIKTKLHTGSSGTPTAKCFTAWIERARLKVNCHKKNSAIFTPL